jgi:hypothetical protein
MIGDVVPIQAFILVYLALATVRFFAVPWWGGILAAVAFVPLARDRRGHPRRLARLPHRRRGAAPPSPSAPISSGISSTR